MPYSPEHSAWIEPGRRWILLGTSGLTKVSTDDLKQLLALVHRGELACPIDRIGLATTGMLRIGDDIELLRGLEVAAVKAVLVGVLAERPPRR